MAAFVFALAWLTPTRRMDTWLQALVTFSMRTRTLISPEQGWILVHSEKKYGRGKDDPSPTAELRRLARGWWWHWSNGRYPVREDGRPHRILFSWRDAIFAEGTATITRHISDGMRKLGYQFAFVLLTFTKRKRVTLAKLPLGKRRKAHRSMIRLTPAVLLAYDKKKR